MFIVVQPTGFMPHFLYGFDEFGPRWLTRKDLAKRFTRREAQRIADQLNAKYPQQVNPVTIQPVKESCPCAHVK